MAQWTAGKVLESEERKGFCPGCENEAQLTWNRAEETVRVKGKQVLVEVSYYVCQECGETFDDPQGQDYLAEAYKKAGAGEKGKKQKQRSPIGDYAGFAFFTFAAMLAGLAAWEHPTLLAWLSVAHNGLLAGIYAVRRPAARSDQRGLLLGLLAAAMPLASYPDVIPTWLMVIGLAGYGFTLWSLMVLGKSFGIAPADRGLVKGGPYRIVRHPMSRGELAFRGVMVISELTILNGLLLVALVVVQVARIRREERIIAGYEVYKGETGWRLIPGVW